MKNAVIERFDRVAEGYNRLWAPPLAPASVRLAALVETAYPDLAAGERRDVLDLGCGTGSFLVTAAPRWPGARLVGLDGSAGMLAVARREVARLGPGAARRVHFTRRDAAASRLGGSSIDAVVSAFVVQMVPDRAPVLAEIRRVLRPGGVVAIAGWLDEGDEPWAAESAFEAAVEEAGVARPPSREVRAGHFDTIKSAAEELEAAGFADVAAEPGTLDYPFTAESYYEYEATMHEIALFDSLDPETLARFRSILERRLRALTPEQLRFRASIVYLSARRP